MWVDTPGRPVPSELSKDGLQTHPGSRSRGNHNGGDHYHSGKPWYRLRGHILFPAGSKRSVGNEPNAQVMSF